MNASTRLLALLTLVLGLTATHASFAQTLLTEDFTGQTSSASGGVGNWLFFNGACLTAGTSGVLTSPATSIPACTAVLNSYYKNAQDRDQYLVGGAEGYLGGTSAPPSPLAQQPDPNGSGALRFTNGSPFGNQERGAIVSTNAYSSAAGIQVTFRTVTYGGSGADGISFYLMDGCVPVSGAIMPSTTTGSGSTPACAPTAIYPTDAPNVPAIGATGGSLAYTCSNTNGPANGIGVTYDGLTGGYLGLGIDEYGNFLNQSDNTASGYGFQPGRIGLRGAGAISWPALSSAYGVNPNNPAKPYYPASLASCPGSYNFDANANLCVAACPTGGTYTASGTAGQVGSCSTPVTPSCPSGSSGVTYMSTLYCVNTPECSSGYRYHNTQSSSYPAGYCQRITTTTAPDTSTPITTVTSTPVTEVLPAQLAVQQTCQTGFLYNYSAGVVPAPDSDRAGTTTLPSDPISPNANNTAGIMDYPPIPGANLTLPAGNPLYNGSATTRSAATTITYNLQITSDGYLSLAYSYGVGAAYQNVISNKSILASNGTLPAYVRFGFAGSTGGSTNVHEILCFKSQPAAQSASSASVNEKQSAKVETGTFAYFAYYDQNNWVGRVTANGLSSDPTTGLVTVASTPTWDASCDLTLIPAGQTCASTGVAGPTPALAPGSRVILTYNGGGVPFEWGSLSTAQQAALNQGDSAGAYRLDYLRGGRTNEVTSAGTCSGGSPVCFRSRTSVLGDIVDSSPTWVGPPQSPYTATWRDKLYPSTAPAENSGTQTYLQFVTAEETRPNVVYVGSNDGMLHGFRSGSADSTGAFSTATTPNDGQEVLAYVPGSLLLSAGTGGACATLAATGSVVQNIHGVTPAYTPSGGSAQPACVTNALDFSNIQYGHDFFVDATPGTGDLYYNGAWHTWLVGGLGAGGAALYALDVTDPTSGTYTQNNAASLVLGEWTAANLTCAVTPTNSASNCGPNLGATYGTPIIRRLHDGRWAVIFGNGFGSSSGDAGIFVMTINGVNSTTGLPDFTTYYLTTGSAGTHNGIAYVTSADLDGDHVTDYVYAGDLLGNLWRFDLTSATEGSWAVSAGPLFKTPAGQPITTAVTVSSGATTAGGNTIVIAFGTGQRTQFTNTEPVTLQTAPQSLYGVWDWNMTGWNAMSSTQYAALTPGGSGLTAPGYTLGQTNLLQETFQINTTDGTTRDIAGTSAICWAGSPSCTASPQFGWYLNFIGPLEQVVYNPQLLQGVFTVNSIVPANNQPNSCTINNDTGFTYAISVLSGAAVQNFFVSFHDAEAAGIQTNAVGTSFPVTSSTGSIWLVSQTVTNQPLLTQVNPGANGKGRRLTWVQLR